MNNILVLVVIWYFSLSATLVSIVAEDNVLTLPIISHDVTVPSRRLESDLRFEGPLFKGDGTHYVELWIGTPPQRQTMIIDTGSSTTAFPCETCKQCGQSNHVDDLFKQSRSSSFKIIRCRNCAIGQCKKGANKCGIHKRYLEGSHFSAHEVEDVISFGEEKRIEKVSVAEIDIRKQRKLTKTMDLISSFGIHFETTSITPKVKIKNQGFPARFACQTSVAGQFRDQIENGIMGMNNSNRTIWKQMKDSGLIQNDAFSLCFAKSYYYHAGVLNFGGTDERLHKSKMLFVRKLQGEETYHTVYVKAIYLQVGESNLSPNFKTKRLDINYQKFNDGEVILDSGSTNVQISSMMKNPFVNAFKELVGSSYFSFEEEGVADLSKFPSIVLHLEGLGNLSSVVPFIIRPQHYRHHLDMDLDEGEGGILGAAALMNKDVLFDDGNSRIGFADSDCDYSSLLGKKKRIPISKPYL